MNGLVALFLMRFADIYDMIVQEVSDYEKTAFDFYFTVYLLAFCFCRTVKIGYGNDA